MNSTSEVLATFTFKWVTNSLLVGNKLTITKNDNGRVKSKKSNNNAVVGCGKLIQWGYMPPVEAPPEVKKALGLEVGTREVIDTLRLMDFPRIANGVWRLPF